MRTNLDFSRSATSRDVSAVPLQDDEFFVIEDKTQLVEYLASGCQPADTFRLGSEQESFVYYAEDLRPAEYDGPRPGIRALMESMVSFGWTPVDENGLTVALRRGEASITLEPGGQLELSGAPLQSVHQTDEETRAYHRDLEMLAGQLGLSFLALGHRPKYARDQVPWMPKERYRIMRAYMPQRGSSGLDMMQSTCALQVAVDFASEADMVKKFRVALALQPVVAALFASSPFVQGRVSGYVSQRCKVWGDTDPDRCGSLPFVFEDGMGFERYVDYVLDVPMYFVHRNGQYLDASGLSFRDFLAGRLPMLPGERPLSVDWDNHLTTVFPHVRLKRYLEMRGADAGNSKSRVTALAALWAGLLYDDEVLDVAWQRVRDWSREERLALSESTAKYGFKTPFREGTVRDLCVWMLDLSRQGLVSRDFRNRHGQVESCYLEPLQDAVDSGRTFAEQLVNRFEHQWSGDIDVALRAMCQETFA